MKGARTPLSYGGLVEEAAITSWVEKIEVSLAPKLGSIDEIEQLRSENEVVGLFLGPRTSESYMYVLNVASTPQGAQSNRNPSYDNPPHYDPRYGNSYN